MTAHDPGFRSAGLPSGYFGRLGSVHLHIDGAGNRDMVVQMLKELQEAGAAGKLNAITAAVVGPQRKELAATYASHTPGIDGAEQFEYFSTIDISQRQQAIEYLRWILPRLSTHQGIVIEVEQVVSRIGIEGDWSTVPCNDVIRPIESEDAGFRRAQTLPFEIHHAFDIDRDGAGGNPPLLLDKLMDDSTAAGLRLGGWYQFEKSGAWAYRSNAFSSGESLEETVRNQYALLKQHLMVSDVPFRLWTIVEQVLGVWRTPLRAGGDR